MKATKGQMHVRVAVGACPVCGLAGARYGAWKVQGGFVGRQGSCDECGASWYACYRLDDIEIVRNLFPVAGG